MGSRPRALQRWVPLLLAFPLAAVAAQECRTVKGRVAGVMDSSPACTSPTGVCIVGSYSGPVLRGTFNLVGTAVIATADSPTTSVVLVTADTVLQTDEGRVFLKDAAVLRTAGSGELAGLLHVVGGDGRFSGASGTLQLTGTLSAGQLQAQYSGTLCTP